METIPPIVKHIVAIPMFWISVFWQALVAVWKTISDQPLRSAVVALVLYFTMFSVHRLMWGNEAMMEQVRPWLSGLIAVGILGFLMMIYQLVVTPVKIYEHQRSLLEEANKKPQLLDGEIERLNGRIRELEGSNKLASVLENLTQTSKQGSLSNRANELAKELMDAMEKQRKEESELSDAYRERRISQPQMDPAESNKLFWEENQKRDALWRPFERQITQQFAPRIAAIAGELKSYGLTDAELDQWLQNPHVAAYTHTLTRIAFVLSKMAIQMEQKEKGITPPDAK